jgi:hypothetical protein
MAAFPRRTLGTTGNEIVPTSRNFTFGDFPVKNTGVFPVLSQNECLATELLTTGFSLHLPM